MRLTIFTTRAARRVEPGDLIDGGDAGPILVDRVELHLPDAPQPVVLLGRRPGAPSNVRRKALRFDHDGEVRVLPTPEVAAKVWATLVEAVWIAGGDDGTPVAPGVVPQADDPPTQARPLPYRVTEGGEVLQVRQGAAWYTVLAEPDPEPPAPPADEPDPDPEQ